MKIILQTEVDNVGLAGDIVDVANGYGRNYLIPRGMAILATPGATKHAEQLVRSRKAHEASTIGDAEAQKNILESRNLRIEARVDDRGHLYGSVGVNEIFAVLRERGHSIEKKRIDFKKAVKEIGEYEVPVQVHAQVIANVTFEVVDGEGVVTLESLAAEKAALKAPVKIEGEEGEEGVEAVEGAEGEEVATNDVEALAQQALEAARAFEAEQAATEEAEAAAATAEDAGESADAEAAEA